MQNIVSSGVCLVGTRSYAYGDFRGSNGETISGGVKRFAYFTDPDELGEPVEVAVQQETYDALRAQGFATVCEVEMRPIAKNNRVNWVAIRITTEHGEVLRAAS